MSKKHEITLSTEVIEALRDAEVDANSLKLGRQLDRKLYLQVAKVIEALAGVVATPLRRNRHRAELQRSLCVDTVSGLARFAWCLRAENPDKEGE